MSLKYFLTALLVASATAQDYGSNYGSDESYGPGYDSGNKGASDQGSWGKDMSYTSTSTYSSASSETSSSWADWGEATATASAQSNVASQAGEIIVQVVSVSDNNGSLKYYPDSVQAPVGSVVQFQFHPKNHTITESSFAEPCKPLAKNLTSDTRPGLKSGFVPVTGKESTTPVYNVLINDTKPIWIYCGQTNHCAKGMSMVINQNMSETVKTIQNYQVAAAQLPLAAANSSSTPPPPPPVSPDAGLPGSGSPPPAPVSPPSSSTGGFPPVDTAASTTSGTAPATFTGAASRSEVFGGASLIGSLVAAIVALM